MREWSKAKREGLKNSKQGTGYRFHDFLIDLIDWFPQIVLFPFRVMYWLVRALTNW